MQKIFNFHKDGNDYKYCFSVSDFEIIGEVEGGNGAL